MLLARAELANLADNGIKHALGRQVAMAAERFNEAAFTELIACIVEGFGDAVRVEGEHVSWREAAFVNGAIPFLKNTQNCARGLEALDGVIAVQ